MKQERQAVRSRVSVQQPSDKFGASDGSQPVERPSASESHKHKWVGELPHLTRCKGCGKYYNE